MLFYILFLILIPTILSYIILNFIYTKIFKSQKKVSKILVFLGSVGLIIFYYTPYSYYLEPSFWEFRSICKLNELPNDEYKFNKILGYFNQNLESLDWEELNKKAWKIDEENGEYRQGVYEYATLTIKRTINSRSRIVARLLSNEMPINKYNTNRMTIGVSWHTNRFHLDGNEGSGVYWNEKRLGCMDVVKYNYNPKKAVNDER